MPPLSRLFVKTAFVYLIIALALGLLLAAQPALGLSGPWTVLTPAYFHLFMLGWVMQLIIGVGYWMFPKYSREKPRGNETLAWVIYWLLNVGLILRVFAEPVNALAGGTWGWLLAASALLQWLGGMAFVANTWPRIKER